jgi:hypothetical protein
MDGIQCGTTELIQFVIARTGRDVYRWREGGLAKGTAVTTTTIPLPPGAIEADAWREVRDYDIGQTVTRHVFFGARGRRFRIRVAAEQDQTGTVLSSSAYVTTEPHELDLGIDLDAGELREIAADLIAAADEMDAL